MNDNSPENAPAAAPELQPIRDALTAATLVEDDGPPEDIDTRCAYFARNDIGNAQRLMVRYGHDMMFVRNVGWHWFIGTHWDLESGDGAVRIAAQHTTARIRREAKALKPMDNEGDKQFNGRIDAHRKFATASGNSAKISGMIAQAEPHMLRSIAEVNADPWLFNCANGTLALKDISGADAAPLRRHDRADLITRHAPVKYNAESACPLWRQFMNEILPAPELQRFLQTWFGYCLSGDTGEQYVVCLHGQGANGKSTIIDVMTHLMGDYAMTISFSSLLHDDRRRGGDASPDLARLPGARLVVAAEPETGAKFSESLLKTMTGGDAMTVRHLNRDFFEFQPNFKLTLSFNNKPAVRGQDEGIWRRLLLVPFKNIVPRERRDVQLKYKLRAELSGILNWALDGLRLYYENGLSPPDAVSEATAAYRDESDPVGQFIGAWVVFAPGSFVEARDLYEAYRIWCSENAADPISSNLFGRIVSERGFERQKTGTIYYRNRRLTDDARTKIDAKRSGARGGHE